MKKVVDTMLVLAMLASSIPGLAEDIAQESLTESGKGRQTASGEEADPPAAPEKPLPTATQPDSYDAVMNVTMDTTLAGEMVASTITITCSASSPVPRLVRMPYSSCSIEAVWVVFPCILGESSSSW